MTDGFAFLLGELEAQREEKRRFFAAQINRLRSRGVPADLFHDEDPDLDGIGPAQILIGDLDCLIKLDSSRLGSNRIFVPLIWNPYTFLGRSQAWVRETKNVPGVLAPSASAAEIIRRYQLSRPVGALEVAIDYQWTEQDRDGVLTAPNARIGYLAGQTHVTQFVRGCLLRQRPEFLEREWVELDFERPDGWCHDLPRVSALLSFRSLCGSSIPLLDAMALGIPVIGLHGGGLSQIASKENGLWVNSATPDDLVPVLSSALHRLQTSPESQDSMIETARESANAVSADAVFDNNWGVWVGVIQLARSFRQQIGG